MIKVIPADDHRVALATDIRRACGALGDGAERVLVERALVMQHVCQNVSHR